MYLLIHVQRHFDEMEQYKFTSHYVSINSDITPKTRVPFLIFTSHYVSINSGYLAYQPPA